MITSTKNPKVKQIHSLQSSSRCRREEGLCVLEGIRLIEESQNARCKIDTLFYTENKSHRIQALIENLQKQELRIEQVSENVMRFMSDTQTPQGILAVVEPPGIPIPPNPDFVLFLDSIRDPGNLGTILRTAAAAGVHAVFLAQDTVDPFSPKVLRSAVGAHFRIPIRSLEQDELDKLTGNYGLRILVADAKEGLSYTEVNMRRPIALVIGGEAEGAGSKARKFADEFIRIPMPGKTESLNAAVAAGILMFEAVRQRSKAS